MTRRGDRPPKRIFNLSEEQIEKEIGKDKGASGQWMIVKERGGPLEASTHDERGGESLPFASVRLRTSAAKRFKRVESATAPIWKLLTVAEKRFRKLNAPHLLRDVFEGRKFVDGKPVPLQRKTAA